MIYLVEVLLPNLSSSPSSNKRIFANPFIGFVVDVAMLTRGVDGNTGKSAKEYIQGQVLRFEV